METAARRLFILFFILSHQVFGSPLLLTIRGSDQAVASYCAGSGCHPEQVIRAQAQEFENGNTF